MLKLVSGKMLRAILAAGAGWMVVAASGTHASPVAGATPVTAPDKTGRTMAAGEDLKANDYLAAAAKITIRIKGNAELSGEYRVGPDQTISLPVIGRVQLSGKDSSALEAELANRTAAITKREAFVTVEIAAYRPIFVTGAVHNPGAVEWQPQMTVLQAIVLAGGPERLLAVGGAANPLGRIDMFKSADGQRRDLATLARLRAARADASEIAPSQQLIELVGSQVAAEMIAAETEILLAERTTFLEKRRIINQSITAEKEQIASLRVQLASIKQQLEARLTHLENMKGLKTKGLLTNDRLLEQEIKVSDLREKTANIEVGIAKSIGTLATLELSQVTLVRDRQAALSEEIAKVERFSTHVGMDLQAAREISLTTSIKPAAAPSDSSDSPAQYQIVRKGGQASLGSLASTLFPGDVLIVLRR